MVWLANAVFEGERARITIVGPAAKSFVLPTYIPGQWIPKCGPRIEATGSKLEASPESMLEMQILYPSQ